MMSTLSKPEKKFPSNSIEFFNPALGTWINILALYLGYVKKIDF